MNEKLLEDLLLRIDSKLDRLEERLDRIEFEKPGLVLDGVAIVADTIDENFNPATEVGTLNLAKIETAKKLLGQLAEEETLEALEVLTKNMKNLAKMTEQMGQAENVISVVLDSFDEFFAHAMEKGLEIEDFTKNLKRFSFHMLDIFESGALNELMESGILDPAAIKTVGGLARSMATSGKLNVTAGPLRAATAILNPDVQRTVGFLLTFAAHFGRTLNDNNVVRRIET